jgi:hypothetical protein
MSPVRLPDDDDVRAPLFRNRAPRRKNPAKVPPDPPKEPNPEEGTDCQEDSPRNSKEDEA